MGQRIVECVPNFSEGRDLNKIKQITDAIEAVPGVSLLDVEPGADTNRTVVTFVGAPEPVTEAAFQAVAKASQVLDMSSHHGTHPRMGATDVCPFVPVEGLSMEECVQFACQVGERIGRELHIPVFLYEAAATKPERKNLATVRKGEYEGLADRLKAPEWAPDFGPAKFNPKTGATCCGAREFLIAYNITLNTRDKNAASDIAFELRERGRSARRDSPTPYYRHGELYQYEKNRFPCGNCDFSSTNFEDLIVHCSQKHDYDLLKLFELNEKDPKKTIGENVLHAGKFKYCKAIGWYVDEYKRAQLSINLTNYKITPPHLVLEETRKLATERGLVVTGSEVVGVIPFRALLNAGKYYLSAQGKSPHIPVYDILEAAVFSMGLNDVSPFEIRKKVIGLPRESEKDLVSMSVLDFTDEVSRDTPAPGGGSIAALAGALGAALASMVSNLTLSKPNTPEKEKGLLDIAEKAQTTKDQLILAVDEDTAAFNSYLEATRLPKNTPDEIAKREERMQDGLKKAVNVPFSTASLSFEAMKVAHAAAMHGNPASISDAAVGNTIAFAGVRGGIWNVLINLKDIKDQNFIKGMRKRCAELLEKAEALQHETTKHVDLKL